jgi:hypothetical protein
MTTRAFLAALVALTLFSCGVKSDLDPPEGGMPDTREIDRSRPPQPLGQ